MDLIFPESYVLKVKRTEPKLVYSDFYLTIAFSSWNVLTYVWYELQVSRKCVIYWFFAMNFKVEKIEDSFEVIKSKPKPLAAYLFTNNEKLKTEFIKDISAGGMLINDTILHVSIRQSSVL